SVGAGTAGTNVSLVDDDYIESFVGEGVRDEGPGDSCTQNDNIALQILPERWINAQQTILQRPEGSRGNQIHAQRSLCQIIVVEKIQRAFSARTLFKFVFRSDQTSEGSRRDPDGYSMILR